MSQEPFKRAYVLKHARHLWEEGDVAFSIHAEERAEERALETTDIENVILGGFCKEDPRHEKQGWTYRIETPRMTVVVAFRCDTEGEPVELVIVTGWRD
jgi:hypothetical protein